MENTFRNHQERAWNIKHMRDSIDLLLVASKGWTQEEAKRGERTIKQLERQIAETFDQPYAA